jgi:uncharacterized membrane protein YqjE
MANPAQYAGDIGATGAQARAAEGPSGVVAEEAAAAPEDASVLAALRVLTRDAWSLVQDHLLLATLEAQRAGKSLTRMIIAGIFAAVLLVTSWLALVAAAIFWWVDSGASWAQALVAMAVLNIAVGVAAMLWIRLLAADLLFSATLRTLRTASHPEPGAGMPATTQPVP